jgi:hypothetical protein
MLKEMRRSVRRAETAVIVLAAASACVNVNAVLEQLSEARRLSADLLVHFTKGADAANRAVMADTDEASVAFAREAEQAVQAAQQDSDALRPILDGLKYSNESQLLQQFATRFDEYRSLDRKILDLAVENTNLKAQRLSFGPAQEAADTLRDSLEAATRGVSAGEKWHAEALVAQAVETVREIQLLQAPHIADADEAVMTRMEKRMASSETAARKAVDALAPLVPPASRPKLAAATDALDRFVALNAEIIGLSRRNTNVRSLALSLDQKRTLTAACEESLRALRDALAKRGYTSAR